MTLPRTGRAAAWLLSLCMLLAIGCKQNTTDEPGPDDGDDPTPASMDGAWFKAWTSDYQYDNDPTHLCTAVLAEYSGTSFTLSFYRDTVQVFGLKGTYTKSGDTSGTLSYTASQKWNSSTKKWESGSYAMTQTYSLDASKTTSTVSDWNKATHAYSKVTFSRPSSVAGDWGGNYDFGPGMENTSMTLAADGTYKFYEDGVNTQTGTWQSGSVSGGGLFLRSPVTQSASTTGIYCDYLTPYTVSGSVMTLDQGSGPDYVVTKAAALAGTAETLAGNGGLGFLDSVVGTSAMFNAPEGLCVYGSTLYVADTTNHRIRAVDLSTTETTTLAGSGSIGYLDANGTTAVLAYPTAAVSDGVYLYFVVRGGSPLGIRKMTLSFPYTVSGAATDNFTPALTGYPYGIALSGNYLYVVESTAGRIRRVDKSNPNVNSVFATGLSGSIRGIAADDDFLYVSTGTDNRIVRIDIATGTAIETIAGTGEADHLDGYGTEAKINNPWGLAVDANYLYIAEYGSHTIRRMHLGSRYVDTLAGTAGTSTTNFYNPTALWLDGSVLYASNYNNGRISKIR